MEPNLPPDFTIHYAVIPFSKYGEPTYLIPFGDIHRCASLCHEEKWQEFLAWARNKKRCYFLGMGDYLDTFSGSEREILSNPHLHDSTVDTLEMILHKSVKKLAKELEFMNGRLIGLLEGNHFGTFQNGTTTTQKLCELLQCKYLGVNGFIRLAFQSTTGHKGYTSVDIWAHHGLGAARLHGGSMNRVEAMAEIAEADIYLMGHDHKKSVAIKSRLKLVGGGSNIRLAHRKVLMARTGSFLRGYVPGEKSYVARRSLNPTDLGVVKIELTPKRDQSPGSPSEQIDIHASL